MNVLTISKCLPYIAGPAVLAFEEARMLVRMGHQVDFVTYAKYPSGAIENFDTTILKNSGINFHFVEVTANEKVVGTLTETALLSSALRAAKARRFDFVNAHFAIPHGLVAIRVAEELGIPSVVTLHGSDVWTLPHQPQFDEASRLVFERTSILITVSQSLQGETLQIIQKPRRIEVSPIGVNLRRFTLGSGPRSFDAANIRYLYAGRFAKVKRLDVLLQAFEKFQLVNPGAELILVGIGEEEKDLRVWLKKRQKIVVWPTHDPWGWSLPLFALGPSLDVTIISGEFAKLPEIYQSADIFVLASEKEGFPNSLCEAAASGLPIITTPVGSVSTFFQEGVNCLFVKVGDADDLFEKMRKLSEDLVLRKAMAMNNLALAREHFDLEKRCRRLLQLVEKYKQGEK